MHHMSLSPTCHLPPNGGDLRHYQDPLRQSYTSWPPLHQQQQHQDYLHSNNRELLDSQNNCSSLSQNSVLQHFDAHISNNNNNMNLINNNCNISNKNKNELLESCRYVDCQKTTLTQQHPQGANFQDFSGQEKAPKECDASTGDWGVLGGAFLAPEIWHREDNGGGQDMKLECMDMDDFLCENQLQRELLRDVVEEEGDTKPPLFLGEENALAAADLPLCVASLVEGGAGGVGRADIGLGGTEECHSPGHSLLTPTPTLSLPSPTSTTSNSTSSPPHSPQSVGTQRSGRFARGRRRLGVAPPVCQDTSSTDESVGLSSEGFLEEGVLGSTMGGGMGEFDPRTRTFSEEELRPPPLTRKGRKQQYVPPEMKDDKYWARRRKNNLAAKRSRDARRVKETQIALRATFLEKQNNAMSAELEKTKAIVENLKKRLAAYEPETN